MSRRYTLEERDRGFFRYRVIYHLGYVARAGNDSIVWKRFRTRKRAERWMGKVDAREWRDARAAAAPPPPPTGPGSPSRPAPRIMTESEKRSRP